MDSDRTTTVTPAARGAFRAEIQHLTAERTRTTCYLTISLYLAFLLVDLLIYPDQAFEFLLTNRLPLVALHLVALGLTWTGWGRRYARFIAMAVYATIGIAVVDLVLRTGGGASGYYAGLSCIVLGYSVLMPWGLLEALITSGIIFAAYLGGVLVLGPLGESGAFLNNVCFLLSAIVIGATATFFQFRLRRQEFLARRSLAQVNARLKEMDAYKSQFFSNITHELRTPLTLILSPVEALLSGDIGDFDKRQTEHFTGIHRNALRLLRLINDLLDLAKLEESRTRLKVRELDLARMVEEIAKVCEPLARRKQIDFVRQVEGAGTVHIDPDRMERVVINLLANAFKFTDEGGTVTLAAGGDDREAWFEVRDTGIGIPEDQLSRIFDRFSQVDQTSTRRYGGTGIGLALVRELVNLHGGRIQVTSEVGQGTTMRVRLKRGAGHYDPQVLDRRAESSAVAKGRRAEDRGIPEWTAQITERRDYRFLDVDDVTERRVVERGAPAFKEHKILIVEDNADMIRFIHFQLRDRYQVVTATNGGEGLERALAERPDLIVSDLMMPVMDGIELCNRLKSDTRTQHIPVILLTAKSDLVERVAARDRGADAFLAKPFSPRELLAVVAQLLKSRHVHGEMLLRNKMASLDLMSAGLAHEINNPLNFLKNALAMVVTSFDRYRQLAPLPDDPAVHKQADKLVQRIDKMRDVAEKGVERISRVVELMQRYSREGFGHEPERYLLDDAVRHTVEVLTPGIDKDVSLELDLSPGVAVHGVPEEVNQVITNLVQNALDAVGDGGQVQVGLRVSEEGDFAVLTVRDDGPGIDPEALARIFTPFFSTKGPGRGMGLGLTITYSLIQRAGGSIDVHTEVGAGTEFVVRLPLGEPAARQREAPAATP